ncbi:MAG: alkylmercury lyase family protein [Acidimicrobiia bacterium]|nr:alkylmercury lyase family protein [Acidimicrobiia bacterium]
MKLTNSSIHHAIIRTIVDRGYAPDHAELGNWSGRPVEEVVTALEALADDHGVVLHPGTREIWIAHPFSLAPTAYVVRADGSRWWGTCAWCSLGIVELAGGTATITAQLAWSTDSVTIRIDDGFLVDTDFVIHFPIPMVQAWTNVVYTCSMMALFRDEESVAAWAAHHGKPVGDIRPIAQIWEFAREWYGRHLDSDWRKWTTEEAAAMFARHGLDGPIWSLESGSERF